MDTESLRDRLRSKGLKVTPRRISILEAIIQLKNHPSAEEIMKHLRNQGIDIATATVYKALDVLVINKVINRVDTEHNITRFDAIPDPHHHLINTESGMIKDYRNKEINEILMTYFDKHKIHDFDIEEVKLQIIGKFRNVKNK